MNNCTFAGNLGRDARTGTAGANNTPYLSFPLGVTIGRGDNQRTLWVGCTLWGKRAESKLVNYLGKGAKVVVSGEADLDMYDKNDGTKGATLTLRVNELSLMDGKDRTPEQKQAPASQPAPADPGFEDDIPF